MLKIEAMILSVTNENNEPVIKLAGSILERHGFNVNDAVSVKFSENQIIISKNEDTAKIQEMERINPCIRKLIDEFGLDLVG